MINSTQQSVPIAGVKDGIVIMKNGSYRMILEISAVNFALKSEQEQNSLVFQYQSFLNSLHFPIEIVVRSKRLDLSPYLNKVKQISETSINELIKMQVGDYVDFVGKLVSLANIMKKSFYVVISYDPVSVKKLNILDSFFNKSQKFDHLKISDTEFKTATDQITERANVVASGLGSMGLHCLQLSTEEILELFYQIYNPEEASKERLTDAGTLASPVIISKDEAGQNAAIQTTPEATERSIDNASLVIEQQKQAASQRRQETVKNEEKETPAQAQQQANPPQQQNETAANQANQPIQNQAPVAQPPADNINSQ